MWLSFVRLYHKAKQASDPFVFEQYKNDQIDKKLRSDRKREPIFEKVKINSELHIKLKSEGKSETLNDSRFAGLFEDPEMIIDKESERFKLLKPVSSTRQRKRKDSSSGDENETEQIEQPDILEEENSKAKSEDSFSEGMGLISEIWKKFENLEQKIPSW